MLTRQISPPPPPRIASKLIPDFLQVNKLEKFIKYSGLHVDLEASNFAYIKR